MSRRRGELPEKLPQTTALPVAATAARPPLLDAYVRVSYPGGRRGERFLSPRLQEETIRAYADAHGAVVGRVFVELGRSGTDPRRPELAALLARIEAGTSDGLIVSRLDRLGRSVIGTLRLLERIDAAGARFVSVEDGFDSSTPLGRALLTILLALAELELGRLAESTRARRAHAVARGVHPVSVLPVGYRRGADGRLAPDPRVGPLIAEAFARRAAGATRTELAAFLTAAGVSTPSAAWTGRRVYQLFQNPAYVGEAYSGSLRNLAAHPPLVRRAVWLAAHAASARARARAHGDSLLAGLARCGGCCHSLVHNHRVPSRISDGGRSHVYQCRRQFSSGECAAPVTAAGEALERAVVVACLRKLEAHRPKRDLESALQAAEERLAAVEATVRTHPGWRSAVYDTDNHDVARTRAEVLALWRRLQLAQLPPAAQLRRDWPILPRATQRQLLATALDAVIVFRGREPVEQRLQLVFAGSPRDWYPKMGTRRPLQPFRRQQSQQRRSGNHTSIPSQASFPRTLTHTRARTGSSSENPASTATGGRQNAPRPAPTIVR